MLALLWKNDIDHGLWELLSAAFSYIRDTHTEDGVSIDQFLLVAAQVVPIIPADQYFARSGWTRVGDTLKRIEVSPQELPKATNVSCSGVVRYCFRQGLISKPPTMAHADLRPTKNLRGHPSSIPFAAVASSTFAFLGSSSVGRAIVQDHNPISVSTETFESSTANTGWPNEDVVIDGYDLVKSSAVLDECSGAASQGNEDVSFSVSEVAGLSASVQVENAFAHEFESRMMREESDEGCHVLDNFW